MVVINNPTFEKIRVGNSYVLKLTFEGKFTEMQCEKSVLEMQEVLGNSSQQVEMVWDCTKMEGYDSSSRTKWQNMLMENRSVIGAIWLVTDNLIIRAGAKVISKVTSFDIKPVRSINEIEELKQLHSV